MGETTTPVMQIKSMAGDAGALHTDALARLEREVDLLKQAVGLLGLKPCPQCCRYFRTSDRGARFDGGEVVCMDCLERWWAHRREQLSVSEREVVERRLVTWLVNYHDAKVVQPAATLGENPSESPGRWLYAMRWIWTGRRAALRCLRGPRNRLGHRAAAERNGATRAGCQ